MSPSIETKDCDDHLEPFVLSYAPTEASKSEPTTEQINFGAELETKIDTINDATKLQPENTGTVRDSTPRVPIIFPRFSDV